MVDKLDVQVGSNLIDGSVKYDLRAYSTRWLILFIFMGYNALSAFQWIEYAIMTNIVMRYYNVSSVTVDWTSMVYMALYAPLVIPASYIIDKKGLRTAALIGGLGTALGTVIKVFSINRDCFYVVLIGQSILAASQLFILPLPPRIAAVWFKPNEVSTACSLSVFGNQFGCALGFVLPPIIVRNHPNPELIGEDLKYLCWGLTGIMAIVALAIVVYFPAQPPKPPSIPQAIERQNQTKYSTSGFFKSIKLLFKNGPFVAHVIAYGINIGVFSAISTLLNQFILQYFENAEQDAGRMGLLMVIVGMIGSIAFGVFLDKTHYYKETTFLIYLFSSFSVVFVMFSLEFKSLIFVYISLAIVGLFTCAYMPVGFEFAMELNYPSPESTATGLLMAPSQVLGVIFTLFLGQLNQIIGPFWALSSQAAFLLLGVVITGFIPNLKRRQDAFKLQNVKGANDAQIE